MLGVRRYGENYVLHLYAESGGLPVGDKWVRLLLTPGGVRVCIGPYDLVPEPAHLVDDTLRLLVKGVMAGTAPPEPLLDRLREVWPEGWAAMDEIFAAGA